MIRLHATPVLLALSVALAACARRAPPATAVPVPPPDDASRVDTVTIRDPALAERVTRLELQVLEREAQIDGLLAQLGDARQEVVRTMAKLQTTATRAEAASALAEAEVAVQALRPPGGQAPPEQTQARQLLAMSSTEFNQQNYGGAVYLANQAKQAVNAARARLAGVDQGDLRPGETVFAAPLKLQATARVNVREGPGRDFAVLFILERGVEFTGHAYVEGWIRVMTGDGRSGWVFSNLVGRRQPS